MNNLDPEFPLPLLGCVAFYKLLKLWGLEFPMCSVGTLNFSMTLGIGFTLEVCCFKRALERMD